MQHSVVDLENYARLYTEDRRRESELRQRASEAAAGKSLLRRMIARAQTWFGSASRQDATHAAVEARPAQLVPVPEKALPASADPYAGMIVLVRGPREPCSLDAA